MKNILVLLLCMAGLSAFGAGEPIQRSVFTTNVAGASFSGNTLTNINLSDGGTISNNATTIGSDGAMNPQSQRTIIFNNGSPTGWADGGDPDIIQVNKSTNFIDSGGGFSDALMGYGATGATVLGITQGPSFKYVPTNRSAWFVTGASEIVANYSSPVNNLLAFCAPGGGTLGADSGNYSYLQLDFQHGVMGVPLITNANGGTYQPNDVVYDFTSTAPTTAPGAQTGGYIDSNGNIFTGYSNNAAKTHLFLTGNLAAPAAFGNLTRISGAGTGDATISYSSVAASRTWNGWAFNVEPRTGNIGFTGNATTTNGTFINKHLPTAQNGVNLFLITTNLAVSFGNGSGLASQSSRSIESVALGDTVDYVALFTASAQGWNGAPSLDVGTAAQLDDGLTIGSSVIYANGAFGSDVKTKTGDVSGVGTNYTLTMSDSLILDNGSGTMTNTLPNAASHASGRIYTIKNVGGTNALIVTTSSQTIDGKLGYTNAPQGSVTLQCDGSNWRITDKYLGNPTNTAALTATGITNTWNWPATAYVLGTAITYTNFNNAGIAVFTNTTLINDSQAIHIQTGGFIRATSGLSGTMVANGN